eukprot:c11310_g1_i4.p1 GENE.c11310_g1_i4~~c11310_g1_i4.p1  ORF type:complete len:399 (-),score=103.87 c11310_g1_i4:825-2021(-)
MLSMRCLVCDDVEPTTETPPCCCLVSPSFVDTQTQDHKTTKFPFWKQSNCDSDNQPGVSGVVDMNLNLNQKQLDSNGTGVIQVTHRGSAGITQCGQGTDVTPTLTHEATTPPTPPRLVMLTRDVMQTQHTDAEDAKPIFSLPKTAETTTTTPTGIMLPVFVGQVSCASTPTLINVHNSNETVWSFACRLQANIGVPIHKQTIKVLDRNITTYCMGTMSESTACTLAMPTSCAVLVLVAPSFADSGISLRSHSYSTRNNSKHNHIDFEEADIDGESDNNSEHFCAGEIDTQNGVDEQCQEPAEGDMEQITLAVRKQLTSILNDRNKDITLNIVAKMTSFSKSALSLWRRGVYKGNNEMITRSVLKVMRVLEENQYQYVSSIHDDSCSMPKRRFRPFSLV